MGIAYRCDAALGCTFVVWDREVTPGEWREHHERMFGDPAFPPGSLMLADLSSAGGAANISTDVVKQMAATIHEKLAQLDPIQLAIVPNGAWDKARMLERSVEGSGTTTIVFNDLHTACTWLGLSEEEVTAALGALRAELEGASR